MAEEQEQAVSLEEARAALSAGRDVVEVAEARIAELERIAREGGAVSLEQLAEAEHGARIARLRLPALEQAAADAGEADQAQRHRRMAEDFATWRAVAVCVLEDRRREAEAAVAALVAAVEAAQADQDERLRRWRVLARPGAVSTPGGGIVQTAIGRPAVGATPADAFRPGRLVLGLVADHVAAAAQAGDHELQPHAHTIARLAERAIR